MEIKSIFGDFAGSMQMTIDSRMNAFRKPWYEKYFDFAPAKVGLDYETIVGRTRVAAAASVTSIDDKAPLRARPNLEKYKGEVAPIQEKLQLNQKQYRDFLMLQALPVSDETKRNQILDLIFNDVKTLGEGVDKRLDIMALEAISTGKISLTVDNNPDGIVLDDPLDLLMPTGNKVNVAKEWSDATASPFDDWTSIRDAMQASGRSMAGYKVLMSFTKWLQFAKLKSVADTLTSYNALAKGASIVTIDRVNEYLSANMLPNIEIINELIEIEKDGIRSAIAPFKADNIVFVPNGKLGVIENSIPVEKLKPNKVKDYADFKRALISKWQQSEPWAEWTRIEALAMPSFEAIDGVFLLSTTKAF